MEAIFEAVIQPLLAVVGYLLLALLVYVVALPLLSLVCTPVVLVMACFGPGVYGDKVASGYKGVWAALAMDGVMVPW